MALLGGNVDMSVLDDLTVTRQIEKIRPLAIISKEPSSKFPGVPTLKELGYDIPVIPAMYGLCGPPGLPEGIQKYLSDVLAKAIKNPEYIRRIDEMGSEPIYLSRPEFHAEYESTYKLVEKNRDAFIEKK
jgi:tripartite-type tricarboxylate transporter receptor subunit TctC